MADRATVYTGLVTAVACLLSGLGLTELGWAALAQTCFAGVLVAGLFTIHAATAAHLGGDDHV